jgi:hypothetical protein
MHSLIRNISACNLTFVALWPRRILAASILLSEGGRQRHWVSPQLRFGLTGQTQ